MTDPLETHSAELHRDPYEDERRDEPGGRDRAARSPWPHHATPAPARAADWGQPAYGSRWIAPATWRRE
jgi:hypothetical protein